MPNEVDLTKAVLLYGAGKEAQSTLRFLAKNYPQTKIYVTADSGNIELENCQSILPSDLPNAIEQKLFSTIVKSPGVSRYRPIFLMAREKGIKITSNLNIWAQFYRQNRTIIAITGTKGKSTTASLLYLMLRAANMDVGLAGNVGVAPLEIGDRHKIVVFELSSYQTADIGFSPDFAAITNLSPEHTDWHRDLEHYYRDKLNLIDREGNFGIALGKGASENQLVLNAIRDKSAILPPLSENFENELRETAAKSRLKGEHNVDNAIIAAKLALAVGAGEKEILQAIRDFKPLAHRLEEHKIGEFLFVDDSISTTPEATLAAINAYKDKPIALIAGGHERMQDYTQLAKELKNSSVKILVCLPVTGDRLASSTYASAPHIEVLEVENLEIAMNALSSRRSRFEVVILSPGAPSYNQFRNFEERGDKFIALAKELFSDENKPA